MRPETKYLIAIIVVVSTSGCISSSRSATVVEAVDGDTLDVEMENGQKKTIRLIGIDSPETGGRVYPDEFGLKSTNSVRCLQRYANKAKEEAEKLENRSVKVFQDRKQRKEGGYGRTLAYIYFENSSHSLNEILLRKGYARFYRSNFAAKNSFREIERRAKMSERGIWSCS